MVDMNESRPRSYRFTIQPDFADMEIARYLGALDEASGRLANVVTDLDPAAIDFVPDGSTLSIARFVKHLVWAELGWISRLGVDPAPAEFAEACADGSIGAFSEPPLATASSDELVRLLKRARSEYTTPALKTIVSASSKITPIKPTLGPQTVREVLMHLVWHWTYHSGQVGLLRELAGVDYEWSFERIE